MAILREAHVLDENAKGTHATGMQCVNVEIMSGQILYRAFSRFK